ncbi:UBC2 [Hepatospora eriocheir]|uniref:UBC2 n=1 Tax=Hepatospora eriocheir TaxID=1081669 RepID=A0A1X0Q901_9MICR|nr:UBC2 [Hepatospora eriocheir]
MNSSIRLQNEFSNIQRSLEYGCYVKPRKLNFNIWDVQISKDGYFFKLTMKFPKQYPNTPPEVKFNSKMFNPNVYGDGMVCLDLIGHKWKPTLTVLDIIKGLLRLLDDPNPESPANSRAAKLFSSKSSEYLSKVKELNNKFNSKYKIFDKLSFE